MSDIFDDLAESLNEAILIAKGEKQPSREFIFPTHQVKTIREKTGLSQDKFAMSLGISVNTLRKWEQGKRMPTGPARVLLNLLDKQPALLDMV